MRRYILFAAAKNDFSCRIWRPGDLRETQYVLYSDGTCYRTKEYKERPPQTEVFRMDMEKFERLKELLETQFDGVQGDWGCDGIQWEMHHYGPTGRRLHSPGRCFAEYVPVLKEIKEILQQC